MKWLAAVIALVMPAILAAQGTTHSLRPATATLAEEFTRVGTLRELSDGRVLVTDERENRLLIADFESDRTTPIGRKGRGPGEFEQVGRLAGTRGDTTLLQDAGVGLRWLVLHGGETVSTLGPADSIIALTRGSLLGADDSGRVLTSAALPFEGFGPGKQRVRRLHRTVHRTTLHVDSIAPMRGFIIETRVTGATGNQRNVSHQVVFSVSEQSLLFPDGWVALALQDPFRVEWHAPSGAVVLGPPLPFAATRVNAAEREHWAERIRAANGGVAFDWSNVPFAETIPPFPMGALHPLPDGSLLILRHPARASPGTEYDVIDRRGVRTGSFRLPTNARIAGIGRANAYVATIDDDGIERLSRHPWN